MRDPRKALLLVLSASAMLCAGNLQKELWYDEAITLEGFVGPGLKTALLDYRTTNNHMFFSALLVLWERCWLLLGLPFWCLRLLPWLFSVAAVALLYGAVNRWRGHFAALWAALLMGTAHSFINFSCQLRGYSLSIFLASIAFFAGLRMLQYPRPPFLALYALANLLCAGTIPTNLMILFALGLWLSIEALRHPHENKRRTILILGVIWTSQLLGLSWYLWHPQIRSQFIHQFFGHIPDPGLKVEVTVPGELGYSIFTDVFWLLPLFAAGMVLSLVKKTASQTQPKCSALLLLLSTLIPLIPFAFVPFFSRVFVPFFPLWFAALGIFLADALEAIAARLPAARKSTLPLCALLVLLTFYREFSLPSEYRTRFAGERPQGIYYQYYQVDFHPEAVIKVLKAESSGRTVAAFTDQSDSVSLEFHARVAGFDRMFSTGREGTRAYFALAMGGRWETYLISNSEPNAHALLKELRQTPEDSHHIRFVKDTGFFKIYKLEQDE